MGFAAGDSGGLLGRCDDDHVVPVAAEGGAGDLEHGRLARAGGAGDGDDFETVPAMAACTV